MPRGERQQTQQRMAKKRALLRNLIIPIPKNIDRRLASPRLPHPFERSEQERKEKKRITKP
jgi:hypothetical protein